MSASYPDQLSKAFALLASDAVADVSPDLDLEERLMAEAGASRRTPRGRKIVAIMACLIVAVTATTVVTAGGVEAVGDWFATVILVNPDGTTESLEVSPETPLILEDSRGSLRITGEQGEDFFILTEPVTFPDDAVVAPDGTIQLDGGYRLRLVPMDQPVEADAE